LAKIATGNMDHIHALLQAGALDLMAASHQWRIYSRSVSVMDYARSISEPWVSRCEMLPMLTAQQSSSPRPSNG
jgi:hypothetical protein